MITLFIIKNIIYISRAILQEDPYTRIKSVVKWYLSGFYKKPKVMYVFLLHYCMQQCTEWQLTSYYMVVWLFTDKN